MNSHLYSQHDNIIITRASKSDISCRLISIKVLNTAHVQNAKYYITGLKLTGL